MTKNISISIPDDIYEEIKTYILQNFKNDGDISKEVLMMIVHGIEEKRNTLKITRP